MSKPTEYKNFQWDSSCKVTLKEFEDSLKDNDWSVMGNTDVDDKVIIHCQRVSQVFSNPFLEN